MRLRRRRALTLPTTCRWDWMRFTRRVIASFPSCSLRTTRSSSIRRHRCFLSKRWTSRHACIFAGYSPAGAAARELAGHSGGGGLVLPRAARQHHCAGSRLDRVAGRAVPADRRGALPRPGATGPDLSLGALCDSMGPRPPRLGRIHPRNHMRLQAPASLVPAMGSAAQAVALHRGLCRDDCAHRRAARWPTSACRTTSITSPS